MQAAYGQAVQAVAAQKAAADKQAAAVTAGAGALEACKSVNTQMLAVGHQVLHLYEDRSFLSMMLKSYEPFLGLKRVELESLVQDYDDKLKNAVYIPGQSPSKP